MKLDLTARLDRQADQLGDFYRDLMNSPGVSEAHVDNVSKKGSLEVVVEARGRVNFGTMTGMVHIRRRFTPKQCRPIDLGADGLERALTETPLYRGVQDIIDFFHKNGARTRERIRED